MTSLPNLRSELSKLAFCLFLLVLSGSSLLAPEPFAQNIEKQEIEKKERTIDEIKTEAVRRAEVGQYPLIGLDPADIREAVASIHTKDKDE